VHSSGKANPLTGEAVAKAKGAQFRWGATYTSAWSLLDATRSRAI